MSRVKTEWYLVNRETEMKVAGPFDTRRQAAAAVYDRFPLGEGKYSRSALAQRARAVHVPKKFTELT